MDPRTWMNTMGKIWFDQGRQCSVAGLRIFCSTWHTYKQAYLKKRPNIKFLPMIRGKAKRFKGECKPIGFVLSLDLSLCSLSYLKCFDLSNMCTRVVSSSKILEVLLGCCKFPFVLWKWPNSSMSNMRTDFPVLLCKRKWVCAHMQPGSLWRLNPAYNDCSYF